MSPERMTFWKGWIVGIIGGIAAHPKPLHNCYGAMVIRRSERYDFRECEGIEAMAQRYSGSLCGIAVSPILKGQSPANFH
jgi:hypothetical protein